MLKTEKEQADFCLEFNISDNKFRDSRLTWEELEKIAEDFEQKRDGHQNTVKQYAEILQECSGVHSLSYRVKDTKHLIEKIIRKNPGFLKKGDSLCKENYEKKITDLMGIRILLLFKEDWLQVHDYLTLSRQEFPLLLGGWDELQRERTFLKFGEHCGIIYSVDKKGSLLLCES